MDDQLLNDVTHIHVRRPLKKFEKTKFKLLTSRAGLPNTERKRERDLRSTS